MFDQLLTTSLSDIEISPHQKRGRYSDADHGLDATFIAKGKSTCVLYICRRISPLGSLQIFRLARVGTTNACGPDSSPLQQWQSHYASAEA